MEPMPPIMAATTEEVRVQTENMSLRSGEKIEQVVTPSQTFGAELRYKRKTLSIKDLESEVIRVALCTLKFDMYDKFVKANTEFTSGRMAPDEFLAQCKDLFKHYPVLFEPLRKHVSKYAAGPR
ncbi:uncharacterized protein [Typha angustifolia]|uniref:uncharacterized protein isoform X1 n=1 Tax=Typha angustifolia TaxID=59011 RepID=UPI003C2ED421